MTWFVFCSPLFLSEVYQKLTFQQLKIPRHISGMQIFGKAFKLVLDNIENGSTRSRLTGGRNDRAESAKKEGTQSMGYDGDSPASVYLKRQWRSSLTISGIFRPGPLYHHIACSFEASSHTIWKRWTRGACMHAASRRSAWAGCMRRPCADAMDRNRQRVAMNKDSGQDRLESQTYHRSPTMIIIIILVVAR